MVLPMKRGSAVLPAVLFGALSLLTFFVYLTAWHMSLYWTLLLSLCVTSGAFAAIILVRTRFSWRSCFGVALGLLIGQWWLVEFTLVQLLWHLRGFAP